MGRLVRAKSNVGPFTIQSWRASPSGELVDGLLVARRATPEGEVLRVAAFDPAENLTLQNARALAHLAVEVASRNFARDISALQALHDINEELHNPALVNSMDNPLVTAVWAELRLTDDRMEVVSAGRAGDGDVGVLRSDGSLDTFCSVPMWTPEAGQAWSEWVTANRPTPEELWMARSKWVGERHHYLNPHLGQFADVSPEVVDAVPIVLSCRDVLIVRPCVLFISPLTCGYVLKSPSFRANSGADRVRSG